MEKQGKYERWNAEKIATAVEDFIQVQKRLPVARELNPKNGLPTRKTFEKCMGVNWGSYAKRLYPDLVELGEVRHQQRVQDIRKEQSEWTKETLIPAIERFAKQTGRLPAPQEYTAENGLPSYTTFCKISQQAMVNHLEQRLDAYNKQSHVFKEDAAEMLTVEGLSTERNGKQMIHLTHTDSTGEMQEFSLPIPLKDLLDKPLPSFWTQERLAVEFQTPSAPLNESLNRCLPEVVASDLKQLSLLSYMLERMEPHHIDWLGERLPDKPCEVSELLRRTDYCCNLRFFRDGTFNESTVSPKEFHPNYEEPKLDDMLRREFESHVERQRLTSGQLFEKTVERAKESGDMERFEGINEYILPEGAEKGKLTKYEFDFVPVVNFGGSEGIYIDCMLKGEFDEHKQYTSRSAGTIKTLKTDLDACKIMGELCGALMYHSNRYVNENLYLFSPTAEIERDIARNLSMTQEQEPAAHMEMGGQSM